MSLFADSSPRAFVSHQAMACTRASGRNLLKCRNAQSDEQDQEHSLRDGKRRLFCVGARAWKNGIFMNDWTTRTKQLKYKAAMALTT